MGTCRRLALSIVVLSVFLLAGCGQTGPEQQAQAPPQSEQGSKAPQESVPEPTGLIAYTVDYQEIHVIKPDGSGEKNLGKFDYGDLAGSWAVDSTGPWMIGAGDYYLYAWKHPQGYSQYVAVGATNVKTGKATILGPDLLLALPMETGVLRTMPFDVFDEATARFWFATHIDQQGFAAGWSVPKDDVKTVGPKDLETPIAPVISPDGTKMAMKTDNGLLVMDMDGENARIEKNIGATPYTFSADNTVLFFGNRFVDTPTEPIWTVKVGEDNTLSDKQQWGDSGSLSYINGIVINDLKGTTWRPEGADLTQIADFSAGLSSIGWENDTNEFSPGPGFYPSPDGNFLVAVGWKNGTADLHVLGPDGSETQLTKGLGAELLPQWLDVAE